MAYAQSVLTYEDALAKLGEKTKHVLLGNGFSIACDPIFSYSSLFDAAVQLGLSERAQAVFERMGTANFEAVMRLLENADWVARTYQLLDGVGSELLEDVEVIKKTLVEAVAKSHLAHTGKVSEQKKEAALAFLKSYKNVFTTNYDLLAYWVNLACPEGPPWGDGFREDKDDPDAEYVVFSERLGSQAGLFYLHGGLHLFVDGGALKKHCWARTGKPLTLSIKEGLDQDRYPLFVAEGSAEQKLEHIQRCGYLWYCLDKFSRIESPLLVFGHTLGESDGHISDALARNMKLPSIAVGIYGDPKAAANQVTFMNVMHIKGIREKLLDEGKKGKELSVIFFDSASAKVWG